MLLFGTILPQYTAAEDCRTELLMEIHMYLVNTQGEDLLASQTHPFRIFRISRTQHLISIETNLDN